MLSHVKLVVLDVLLQLQKEVKKSFAEVLALLLYGRLVITAGCVLLIIASSSCMPWLPCLFVNYRLKKIGNSIYFSDRSCTLYSIDANGKLKWKRGFGCKYEEIITPLEVLGSTTSGKIIVLLNNSIWILDEKSGNIVRRYDNEIGKNRSIRELSGNLVIETEDRFLYFEPESGRYLWHMEKKRGGKSEIVPTSVTDIVLRIDLEDKYGTIFKIKTSDGKILAEKNIKFEISFKKNSYIYVPEILDCLIGDCIFPFPSTYVWLIYVSLDDGMREEVEIIGINVETLDVSLIKIIPKFDVVGLVRKIIIFQDRMIIYTEFNHDSGTIISALEGEALKWRRNIHESYFLFPLTSEIVLMDVEFKGLIFLSPLNGETLRKKETDINMNLNIDDRYGEDIVGNLIDFENVELYILWMKGERSKEKRKEKGLLKLDLTNGKTIWNIQLDFIEPHCTKK